MFPHFTPSKKLTQACAFKTNIVRNHWVMRIMDVRIVDSGKRTWNRDPPPQPTPYPLCYRNSCRLTSSFRNQGQNGMPAAEGEATWLSFVASKYIPSGKAEPPLSRFSETHRSLSLAEKQGSAAPAASSLYALERPLLICWHYPLLFVLIRSIFVRLSPSPVCMIFFF